MEMTQIRLTQKRSTHSTYADTREVERRMADMTVASVCIVVLPLVSSVLLIIVFKMLAMWNGDGIDPEEDNALNEAIEDDVIIEEGDSLWNVDGGNVGEAAVGAFVSYSLADFDKTVPVIATDFGYKELLLYGGTSTRPPGRVKSADEVDSDKEDELETFAYLYTE